VKTVLQTGAGGFLGRAVLRRLKAGGCHVLSLGRLDRATEADGHIPIALPANQADCMAILAACRPALIVHLAAAAPSAPAGEHADITRDFALPLFEAAAIAAPEGRIVTIGSAAEFGAAVRSDGPMTEDDPCAPVTPYGEAKYAVTQQARECWQAGRDVSVLRLFTAAGPGMPAHTVLGNAARQIHSAAPGGPVRLGNIGVERDYLDVDEAARLIVALALREQRLPPLVNIASGVGTVVAAIVRRMVALSGKACRVEQIVRREDALSPARIIGSTAAIAALGLPPSVPTLDELAGRALDIHPER
jgi:nucleoside-diphosphate-sugar epimerase